MPLTPQDIIQREFREALRGYNQSDVDLFLDEVAEEFARLLEENQRAKTKVAALQQEIARFRAGRPDPSGGSDAEGAPADRRRVEGEVRARLRRILEEQLRQLDAVEGGQQTTAERIAREVPQGREPARVPDQGGQKREFWRD